MGNFYFAEVMAVADKIARWLDGLEVGIGVTLGSGLGGFGADMDGSKEISFEELGLPRCAAKGHAGVLRLVKSDGRNVLILDGRVHCYEGHSFQTVVLAVRALTMAGVKIHILTCASGGVNFDYKPGELVLIRDHLNLMGGNPLVGRNNEDIGPRFPNMTNLYDQGLREIAWRSGEVLGMALKQGVYAAMMGPCYETPAEVRMQHVLGADMCGMSTVPEAIAIRHLGAKVLGISCVANRAAGVGNAPLSHDEVVAACSAAAPRFRDLITHVISNI